MINNLAKTIKKFTQRDLDQDFLIGRSMKDTIKVAIIVGAITSVVSTVVINVVDILFSLIKY